MSDFNSKISSSFYSPIRKIIKIVNIPIWHANIVVAFADYLKKIIFEISQSELQVRVITAQAIDDSE